MPATRRMILKITIFDDGTVFSDLHEVNDTQLARLNGILTPSTSIVRCDRSSPNSRKEKMSAIFHGTNFDDPVSPRKDALFPRKMLSKALAGLIYTLGAYFKPTAT